MKAIPKGLFRAYDIRGIANEELTSHNAFQIGRSIGSQLQGSTSPRILLGRDARLSSPRIADSLAEGLIHAGCDIIDIGQVPTPVLYFALQHFSIDNGVVVTGSHNPPEYNGIKIVLDQHCLHTHGITALYDRILQKKLHIAEQKGTIEHRTIFDAYSQAVLNDVSLQRRLRIGLDCGNGITGAFAVKLFERLGCEVHPLFCEVDGTFPNHSPDPTKPENLKALQALVQKEQLDIGIAFDGDGDRMIAVDGQGKILWPDRIMALLAQNVLAEHPNRSVVFDVKCSQILPQAIEKSGGISVMSPSGHSLLKAKMLEEKAIMGGEFSGHILLNDRQWRFNDDGIYAAARLLEYLSQSKQTPTEVFANIADSYSTPEYKLYFSSPEAAQAAVKDFCTYHVLDGANISFVDGLRADFEDCWGLARASNTSPTITLRFEARTQERLTFIQDLFRNNLRVLDHDVIWNDGFVLDSMD